MIFVDAQTTYLLLASLFLATFQRASPLIAATTLRVFDAASAFSIIIFWRLCSARLANSCHIHCASSMQLHRFTRTLRLFADDLSGDRLAAACASRVHSTHMSRNCARVLAPLASSSSLPRLLRSGRDAYGTLADPEWLVAVRLDGIHPDRGETFGSSWISSNVERTVHRCAVSLPLSFYPLRVDGLQEQSYYTTLFVLSPP